MYKCRRFPKTIIQQGVYFKFRFILSYRDIEEIDTGYKEFESAQRTEWKLSDASRRIKSLIQGRLCFRHFDL